MINKQAVQLNEEGLQLLRDGKIEESVDVFLKAIQADENYPFPYCHIGNILAGADKQEEAITWFEKAIQLHPEMATAYYGLANAFYSLHQWDDALYSFQLAHDKGLQDGDLFYMMGMTYLHKGEGHEAIALAYFQSAVEKNEKDVESLFQRGLCSAYLGHLAQAKEDFYRVVELDQKHSDAYFNLGVAYSYEGNSEKALAHFDKAIEVQPNHFLALHARKQLREAEEKSE
ncbi:tetratricopeptide repeat protein [Caldalkalibacillus mannanilyticus]|uniref:tetratricopeptide repeat protein n=1 Tax=Caldalkalibacillus mannanilyticus TaxID=1418 RepID=UPI000468C70F|nr:tetratricopeptide repeat protein [Caldalkalibacillus mannanilyticus]